MTDRPLVILSFDALATSALGCYGSSWNETPAIDAVASGGCVWDRCVATWDDPAETLREIFDGGWTDAWKGLGSVELMTDSETAVDVAPKHCFDQVHCVRNDRNATMPEPDIVETQLGQLVAAAIERDAEDDSWSLLWMHSSFLTQRWDAPRHLFPIDQSDRDNEGRLDEAEMLEAELDQAPVLDRLDPIFDQVSPPHIELQQSSHPDLATSWMRTYGCQVRLIDVMIEILLQSLRVEDPQVMILGTSGFRLGQGGWIGHRAGPLRSPDIRLPVILSDCGPLRIGQLAASGQLAESIREISSQAPPVSSAPHQWSRPVGQTEIETNSSRSQSAVTTPEWFFVRDRDSSEHLFLKPDDVEDFNDIGRIRHDIVQRFVEAKK